MEFDTKIGGIMVFLIIFEIMIPTAMIISSNNEFAYGQQPEKYKDLHGKTLYSIVKQTSGLNDISHIDTGDSPIAISVNEVTNTVYVANRDSNSISVISGETNAKIGEDVPVAGYATALAVNEETNTVYVANTGSDSISVIDGLAHRVVAGITFQVNPSNSGYIECNDLTPPYPNEPTLPSPIGQFMYVYSGTQCIAKPNEGFGFISWEQNNLDGNSTQPISVSRPAPILDSIANFMDPDPIAERWDSLFKSWGIQPISETLGLNLYDSKAATLNVTKFGTFTANFRELAPPVQSEYLIPLYGIIVSTIVGWSIPSIISWARSKLDARKLKKRPSGTY